MGDEKVWTLKICKTRFNKNPPKFLSLRMTDQVSKPSETRQPSLNISKTQSNSLYWDNPYNKESRHYNTQIWKT